MESHPSTEDGEVVFLGAIARTIFEIDAPPPRPAAAFLNRIRNPASGRDGQDKGPSPGRFGSLAPASLLGAGCWPWGEGGDQPVRSHADCQAQDGSPRCRPRLLVQGEVAGRVGEPSDQGEEASPQGHRDRCAPSSVHCGPAPAPPARLGGEYPKMVQPHATSARMA